MLRHAVRLEEPRCAVGTRSHPDGRGAKHSLSGGTLEVTRPHLSSTATHTIEKVNRSVRDLPFLLRSPHDRSMPIFLRALLLPAVLALSLTSTATAVVHVPERPHPEGASTAWVWPVESPVIERAFEAPAHAYGPGHRGLDVSAGSVHLRAPADGVIAFKGAVAGRGVLTIDHGEGLVTTLEPIDATLNAGDRVRRGAAVGTISVGGHTASGTVHFGVRRDGEYINPLLLLGGVPRAVLLPCC